MPQYDETFFDYVNSGSVASAKRMLPALLRILPVDSVLDVGCGQGAWLSVWRDIGIQDVCGLDGDYVDSERLLIPRNQFQSADLTKPFNLKRRFGLVQSLEVAEHLHRDCAEQFINDLCRHGKLVLFSAAAPGQGGDNHVNEQPYDYWRALFAKRKYQVFDCIRPLVFGQSDVEPWYQYNTFMYVAEETVPMLPDTIQTTLVESGIPLDDISPVGYRIRKLVVRMMPVPIMTLLAKQKERLVLKARRRHS